MFGKKKILFLFYFLKSYLFFKFYKFKSRKTIEAYQQKKFRNFKKRVLIYSKYYHPYIQKNLKDFPILEKSDYIKNFDLINTQNIHFKEALELAVSSEKTREFKAEIGGIDIGLSTGTSGKRGVFLVSLKERAFWAGLILAKSIRGGIFRTQRIALILRANNNLYESLNRKRIQFKYFDLMNPIEEIYEKLVQYSPTILVGPPSCLEILARYECLQNSAIRIHPHQVISVAETLNDAVATLLKSTWNRQVEQVYQATEGSLAHTCRFGGFHLNEDLIIFEKEYIDQKEGYYIPIITDFTRETHPIIRYRLTDVLVDDPSPCLCGSALQKIKRVEGRCDDVIWLSGRPIFPDFLTRLILKADERIQDFRLKKTIFNYFTLGILLSSHQNSDEELTQVFEAVKKSFYDFTCQMNVEMPDVKLVDFEIEKVGQKRRRIVAIGY